MLSLGFRWDKCRQSPNVVTITGVTSRAPEGSGREPFTVFGHFSDSRLLASPAAAGGDRRARHRRPQVPCARDSPWNSGEHNFLSPGKTLTQDKLADREVYRMTVLCVTANINSVRGAEASRGPGTSAWIFLEGQHSRDPLWVPWPPKLLLLVREDQSSRDEAVSRQHRTDECDTLWRLTARSPLMLNARPVPARSWPLPRLHFDQQDLQQQWPVTGHASQKPLGKRGTCLQQEGFCGWFCSVIEHCLRYTEGIL